jgi:DNA-binding NarL/FixJ family response regulator
MSGDAILASLRKVLSGERVIGEPQAMTAVLNEFSHVLQQRERERYGLTDQEVEILRLAASGLNNKDIGLSQFWSEITVKRKMQDIYRKLEVKSRAQAVAAAIRLGFI